jgi:hypothetical protein
MTMKNSIRYIRHRVLGNVYQDILLTTCIILLASSLSSLWSFALVVVATLSVAARISTNTVHFTLLDFGLISFFLSSVISTAFAYDMMTALPQLQLRTLFLLLYLALRSSEIIPSEIVTAIGLGMILHCIEVLVVFARSYRQWKELQLVSLVDFRSVVTLTFHGEKPGNYAAIYIATLAIGIYGLGRHKVQFTLSDAVCMVSLALSTVCIVLSFSRSLYISSALCLLLSLWGRVRMPVGRRTVCVVLLTTFCLMTAGVLYFGPVIYAIRDTASLGSRVSQIRSVSGRLSIFKIALHLVGKVGVLGTGIGNYALEIRRSGLTSPSTLTAHAFNTPLEVGIEQGVLGLVTLAAIVGGMTTIIVEHFRTARGKAILGGFAALVLYSMSQTFVVADNATATLLAAFCAIALQTGDDPWPESQIY